MSSYKGHSLFALAVSLMFFINPLLIALTLIGANIPDFDHKFKKDNVYKIIILGLIIFIFLYILNLPSLIGLIIVFLGVIFYFSQHRSFTHSIFGVLTLTSCVSLILIFGFELVKLTTILNNSHLILIILITLLSFLFLNKKLLAVFLPLFFISLFILPVNSISHVKIIMALFLGLFSHIILDSFTPAGVKLFAPISSKKIFRKFGISMVLLLIMCSLIYHMPLLFRFLNPYFLS